MLCQAAKSDIEAALETEVERLTHELAPYKSGVEYAKQFSRKNKDRMYALACMEQHINAALAQQKQEG
jgi:hypothetical protein